jgi:signal transduction histidine kinase
VKVVDNGIGCNIGAILSKTKTNGLKNIQERARLIGAKVNFFSKPDKGLKMELSLKTRRIRKNKM